MANSAARSAMVARILADLLGARADARASGWLESTRTAPGDRGRLVEAFALASRKLGKAPVAPTAEEWRVLAETGLTWPIDTWGADELGRVTLLVTAADRLKPDELEALVDDSYRSGDSRERQAVLKALPLLPDPERFLDTAVDACRSSILPIFEAIACENPYPARHFPELNFNQMVLKAVFVDVPLARVVGLDGRLTDELARMGADYASERRAAGRSVPDDLGRLTRGATA